MATLVNKNFTGTPPVGNGTVQYIQSGNTPDFNPVDWFINPNLSALSGVPLIYWKITGGVTIEEMTSGEKAQVDAALASPTSDFTTYTAAVSTTTSTIFQTYLETSVQKAEGDYLIFVSYAWNADTTSSDIEVSIQEEVDGGGYAEIVESHLQEPSDSAGDFSGTASDQKFCVARMIPRTLTEGDYSWRIQWRTTIGGVEASIWDGAIAVVKRASGTITTIGA